MGSTKRSSSVIFNAICFVVFETIALFFYFNNSNLQNSFISKIGLSVSSSIFSNVDKIVNLLKYRSINEDLAKENFNLHVKLSRINRFEVETSDTIYPYHYIFSKVIKFNRNYPNSYYIINRGSSSGIKKGMGVVSPSGVIGIIETVKFGYSKVKSINNPNMFVAVRLRKNGPVCLMHYDERDLRFSYVDDVPLHYKVEIGDTIFSSGFSNLYPAAIPLGIVSEYRRLNGSTHRIKVFLFEDFLSVQYVSVIENLDLEAIKELDGENE